MSTIDLNLQTVGSIPTPAAGSTTYFTDSVTKALKSKDDSGAVVDYAALGNAITSLTGDVTASGPGAAVATVPSLVVTGKVLTGLVAGSGDVVATDTILQAFGKLMTKGNASCFPTMTDGIVTITSNTTLTRDMYYDTVTINPGVTVQSGGFRVFANSFVNNGTFDRSGNDALVAAAGAALTAGSLSAGAAGGAGGIAAGAAGGASAVGLGGPGGAGGAGSGGAGGAAGAVTLVTAANGGVEVLQSYRQAVIARDLPNTLITGGSGGGGGGGDGTAGGGGGGAGGVMVVCAKTISGTGWFRAHGGNGGTPVTGNRGGGAGGGGGVVVLISENDTSGLNVDVSGGIGSAGTGTGVPGANGSVGRIYRVRV